MDKNLSAIRKKIKNKQLKIAVIGLGYVGFPLAIEFAKKNIQVIGIEIDTDRLNSIKRKESYISDVSTKELKNLLSKGNFCATADFSVIQSCDVVLVCVPTPLKRKNLPNISYIKNAVKSAANYIKPGALIVLESTTYPGTTEEELLPIFESFKLEHGRDFFLCFSPERIDPGNTDFPVNKIPKVIGGINAQATCLGAEFYKIIIDKVVPVSSARTAETVKLLENTFRLINIGLIDELAMMAHKMNIDIWEVVAAAATKPFGFMPFYPGPGVGGHCIPKDPLYLHWKAKSFGFHSRFIRLASDVISYMPEYVAMRIQEALFKKNKKSKTAKILVVGVTYKKNIKDLRQSPSIDLIKSLEAKGHLVSYYDPLIPYLKIKGINLKSVELTKNNLVKFDCVVIATDHSTINYKFLLDNAQLIFDTRNVYRGAAKEKVARL
ncbi:MAG: nucleotide sugar dehydrogenase [Candidatus Omnitrophica bacterium]|nr:nucleotide sugar dehydrogenase [Candidatus Omnitrophota bacterium]